MFCNKSQAIESLECVNQPEMYELHRSRRLARAATNAQRVSWRCENEISWNSYFWTFDRFARFFLNRVDGPRVWSIYACIQLKKAENEVSQKFNCQIVQN